MIHRRLGVDARGRGLLSTGDVLSETLWEICQRLPTFEGATCADLTAWACRVIEQRIRDAAKSAHRLRRDVRRSVALDGSAPLPIAAVDPTPSQELLGREMEERIDAALQKLPARERTLVQLKRSLDATPGELAEFLGFPSSDAARMALQRATMKLLRMVGRTDGSG